MERKVIALFALGNSYQDIRTHIADMYDIQLSNGTINAVTDKLLPELQAWRERDLEAIYPIVWLDAIHYKITEHGRYVSKAVYTILELNIDGKKELLGLYLSEEEGAHHWLSVLTDLNNRGVKDILIAFMADLKCVYKAETFMPQKTHYPVQFKIGKHARESVNAWIQKKHLTSHDYLFGSRVCGASRRV